MKRLGAMKLRKQPRLCQRPAPRRTWNTCRPARGDRRDAHGTAARVLFLSRAASRRCSTLRTRRRNCALTRSTRSCTLGDEPQRESENSPGSFFSSAAAKMLVVTTRPAAVLADCGVPVSSGADHYTTSGTAAWRPRAVGGFFRESSAGISSQVRPSSMRPALAFRVPPHCLKKNGTPDSPH